MDGSGSLIVVASWYSKNRISILQCVPSGGKGRGRLGAEEGGEGEREGEETRSGDEVTGRLVKAH